MINLTTYENSKEVTMEEKLQELAFEKKLQKICLVFIALEAITKLF